MNKGVKYVLQIMFCKTLKTGQDRIIKRTSFGVKCSNLWVPSIIGGAAITSENVFNSLLKLINYVIFLHCLLGHVQIVKLQNLLIQ